MELRGLRDLRVSILLKIPIAARHWHVEFLELPGDALRPGLEPAGEGSDVQREGGGAPPGDPGHVRAGDGCQRGLPLGELEVSANAPSGSFPLDEYGMNGGFSTSTNAGPVTAPGGTESEFRAHIAQALREKRDAGDARQAQGHRGTQNGATTPGAATC